MKISELVKQLNKAKSLYGDLEVSFDETTVNENADPFSCIEHIEGCGVFTVRDDDGRKKKQLVLFGWGDSALADEKDFLDLVRGTK